jgi:osmotically-inducible protein OsmY/nucleotide-binding universal stress UspA family protein
MFENVIVGVGGYQAGRDALELANALLAREGRATLVYVELLQSEGDADSGIGSDAERQRFGLERLRRLRDEAGVSAEIARVQAHSVRRGLYDVACDSAADLIVIGASEEPRPARGLPGSAVHELLEDPPCPVAVAPRGYSAHAGALQRIGVAYDETPESDQALAVARKLAAQSHASLSAYEAIGRPVYARDIWNVEGEIDQDVRAAAQRIAALGDVAAFADVADDAVEGLRRYGANVDLLVLGPHKPHPPDRLMQHSTAQRLADNPPAPLLVLARAAAPRSERRGSRTQDDDGSPVATRRAPDERHSSDTSFVLLDPSRIESDVRDALARDARIKHPELIAISVDMIDTVVLAGTVATIHQRRAAVSDARRVDGVFEAIDRLKVHPPVGPLRADDEIRAAALQRLNADSRIHAERIHVKVFRGRVTLTGYVRQASQRSHAEQDVASVVDVVDVVNEIDVR